jgi:nanoRNase/pAp phosphatase (c-di-AMP/oligoRNAs hydrolase)
MSQAPTRFRLVTRSDFDGLACAVLLKHLDLIGDIVFVHPKDMQDGKVDVSGADITTNLPYRPEVHLCFDHHFSETLRVPGPPQPNHIIDPTAPSAARVVWRHYGGHITFPSEWDEMMEAVDKADSAQFSVGDILDPDRWVMLGFLMDARTGLGRFKQYRISNYRLMMDLIEHITLLGIDEIMELPDVRERVEMYEAHDELYRRQVKRCARLHDNLLCLDLRSEETMYASNRFMIYALYPQCSVSMHVMPGKNKENTVFAVGKSIVNRNCRTNIGELMLEYGGGGHDNAGTCQVDNDRAEQVKRELIARIVEDYHSRVRESA